MKQKRQEARGRGEGALEIQDKVPQRGVKMQDMKLLHYSSYVIQVIECSNLWLVQTALTSCFFTFWF